MFKFVAIALAMGAAVACEGPACVNVDMGSCGNACCNMGATFAESVDDVASSIVEGLKDGGSDGLYTLQVTAEGDLGMSDLREYNISAAFIGQTWHTTVSGAYNDTINMKLEETDDGGSFLQLFSISQIAGALGDSGQNSQNALGIMDSLSLKATGYKNLDESCPAPAL